MDHRIERQDDTGQPNTDRRHVVFLQMEIETCYSPESAGDYALCVYTAFKLTMIGESLREGRSEGRVEPCDLYFTLRLILPHNVEGQNEANWSWRSGDTVIGTYYAFKHKKMGVEAKRTDWRLKVQDLLEYE